MSVSQTPAKILILDSGLSQPLPNRGVAEIYNSGRLLEISNNGKTVRELAGKMGIPDGIEVCSENKRLYWTDMGDPSQNNGRIMSCKADGSDMQPVIPCGGIHTPKQLIIEPTAKKIYVCDREGLRVMRCNLNGSDLETLVQTGNWKDEKDQEDMTRWCVGIAVSTKLGKFFWTQKGPPKLGKGRIFSANIDMPAGKTASDRDDIECLLDNLPEPIDLEFEQENNMLWWTDRGDVPFGNTLNKVEIDKGGKAKLLEGGLLKHHIVAQNFNEAIGLRLHGDAVLVSDMGGSLWKVDMNTGKKERVYEDTDDAYTGMALLE